MAWASSAPDAIAALVQCLQGAPGLEGVKVYDGPVVDGSNPAEALTVAYNPEDGSAVEGQMSRDGLPVAPSLEQYTIQCSAAVTNGNNNAPAVQMVRSRAFALLAAVGAALAADPRLGGVVGMAQVGAWTLSHTQNGSGVVAVLGFAVDIEAFTKR